MVGSGGANKMMPLLNVFLSNLYLTLQHTNTPWDQFRNRFTPNRVLAGHTQRKMWLYKNLVEFFFFPVDASLGGYTLPVVEKTSWGIRPRGRVDLVCYTVLEPSCTQPSHAYRPCTRKPFRCVLIFLGTSYLESVGGGHFVAVVQYSRVTYSYVLYSSLCFIQADC